MNALSRIGSSISSVSSISNVSSDKPPYLDENGYIQKAVDVLCDNTKHLGALTYFIPEGMEVKPGFAVTVPFGTREIYGLALGPAADLTKAKKHVSTVHGKRVEPSELHFAKIVADRYFSSFPQIAARLSPKSGKGSTPLPEEAILLHNYKKEGSMLPSKVLSNEGFTVKRRFLLRSPLVDPTRLAAEEAVRLAVHGQVLVLCPTIELLENTLAHFVSGANRLDAKAPEGAWKAFCSGALKIGIGTRAAALYSASALTALIVVEEDHPGHIESTQPCTNARDIAAARATYCNAALTLIGANPSPSGMGAKVKLFKVGVSSDWPTIRVIDRQDFDPASRIMPPPLLGALTKALLKGEKPLVLIERKKAIRRCATCALERKCTQCDSSLCKHQEGVPCPRCSSVKLKIVGWDKDRLSDLFKGKAKPVFFKDLSKTQNAGLVIIFDIDSILQSAGLHSEALAAKVIISAAESAGFGGTVLVLTRDPYHPVLKELCGGKDQTALSKRVFANAKENNLPPFGRLITIRSGQEKAPSITNWPGTVYGPKKVGSEWEVLVKLKDSELDAFSKVLYRLRRSGKVRLTLL